MTLLVVGTVPIQSLEPILGRVSVTPDGRTRVGSTALPASQGTSAMLAAAATVAEHMATEPPHALLGGDIGRGDGTRAVAGRLAEAVKELAPSVVAFHYMQPLMSVMLAALESLDAGAGDGAAHGGGGHEGLGAGDAPTRLVADAGGMYAAKAAGVASMFELMTPDVGEIGFLADPETTHPAYVTRFLLGADDFDPEALARRAADNGGSSRVLLVKGKTDHILADGDLVATIDSPDVPELEAIGGTGDTITGMAAAFMAAGLPTVDAAVCAAKANREAGQVMRARPDHRASDLVKVLPRVLQEHLRSWTSGWSSAVRAPAGD